MKFRARPSPQVEAIQLRNRTTIHVDAGDGQDDYTLEGSPGCWLVSFSDGLQTIMNDKAFREAYEPDLGHAADLARNLSRVPVTNLHPVPTGHWNQATPQPWLQDQPDHEKNRLLMQQKHASAVQKIDTLLANNAAAPTYPRSINLDDYRDPIPADLLPLVPDGFEAYDTGPDSN